MTTIGRVTRLQPDTIDEYVRLHRPAIVPAQLMALLERAGFRGYDIFREGTRLFAAIRVADMAAATAAMQADPFLATWMRRMAPFMDAPDPLDPWREMERVFSLE